MLKALKAQYPNLRVEKIDVASDSSKLLVEALGLMYGLPDNKRMIAPSAFVGRDFLIGDEINDQSLSELLAKYKSGSGRVPWIEAKEYLPQAKQSVVSRFASFGLWGVAGAGLAGRHQSLLAGGAGVLHLLPGLRGPKTLGDPGGGPGLYLCRFPGLLPDRGGKPVVPDDIESPAACSARYFTGWPLRPGWCWPSTISGIISRPERATFPEWTCSFPPPPNSGYTRSSAKGWGPGA